MPLPPREPKVEDKRQLVAEAAYGVTPQPSCQLRVAEKRFCGCLNPADGESHVSVISSDFAVRRSLVLLLEAEGMMARGFCAVPPLLAILNAARVTRRHCVVIEKGRVPGTDEEGLAGLIARAHRPLSVVVLTADLPRHAPPATAPASISFVDPFAVDDVLRIIRSALATP